jgi:aspartate aminotransferase-like enzyme
MISEIINLTTGPVGISPQVMNALGEMPISHRSPEFKQLYIKTRNLLSSAFHVKETFLLSGSGTLANEAMLQEIKHVGGQGLILSNGEFGNRLIEQGRRNKLDYLIYKLEWGSHFDLEEIENLIRLHSFQWILFCHCETSTGTINDLNELAALAKKNNCLCFVDCMSTVGTMHLDLSNITMATASSGKGLSSIPGLAIVFSNIQPGTGKDTAVYLDLSHYAATAGIPFTISSNLLKALYVSICQKLQPEQFELINYYGEQFYLKLNDLDLVPFSNPHTKVFTIISGKRNPCFIGSLKKQGVWLSHESDYLLKREWCQLATFGYYTEKQLNHVLNSLPKKLIA